MDITLTLKNDFGRIGAEAAAKLDQVVRKTALDYERQAKLNIMTGPKSGRLYGTHQASAPGESPATDTGNLAGSIKAKPTGRMEAEVRVTAEYAFELEFGGAHVAARPYMVPARNAVEPAFQVACRKVLEGK